MALVLVAVGIGIALWWRGRPERHLAEARRLLEAGQPGEAASWLDVPEAAPSTRDRALLLRARAALARGRPGEAVRPLERVNPAGPWAADAAFWKGRTLYAVRHYVKAIAWFNQALSLHPRDADAYRWLAAAAYDLGDRDDAIAALEAVTRLQPRDARAWRTLGLLFKENAEPARALPAYEAALRSDPDQPRVRLELAEVLLGLGRYDDAERQLEACRGGVPEADRLELLARCLRAEGRPDRLREAVEAGLRADPDHPGLLVQRARIALADGQAEPALAWLGRALAANPFNPEWLYQRALALRSLGRSAEAQRDLDRVAQIKKDLAEMEALNERAAQAPKDPEVRYQLGRLCTRLGRPELAVSWYYAALACDPRHAGARAELEALQRRGVRDRAPGAGADPRAQSFNSMSKRLSPSLTVKRRGEVVVLVYFSGTSGLGKT